MAIITCAPGIAPLPDWTQAWLSKLMDSVGPMSCTITETVRTPERQAEIMFNQCVSRGVDAQNALYGPSGRKVIAVFASMRSAGMPDPAIKRAMTQRILAVGPRNVSRHIEVPGGDVSRAVFDIAPSSIVPRSARDSLLLALKNEENAGRVTALFYPPRDLAFHVEVRRT